MNNTARRGAAAAAPLLCLLLIGVVAFGLRPASAPERPARANNTMATRIVEATRTTKASAHNDHPGDLEERAPQRAAAQQRPDLKAETVDSVLASRDIDHLARIALDRKRPMPIRQAATLRLAALRTPAAVKASIRIVGDLDDPNLRAIACSGAPPVRGVALAILND